MTGTKKRIPINGEPAAADDMSAAAAQPAGAGPGADGAPAPGAADLQAELEALRGERRRSARQRHCASGLSSTTSGRRSTREALEARERGQGELLTEMLPVLDNLERALDAAEHHDEGKVIGGVRMVRDLFVELLRRSGVEEIATVGAEFDPHLHDAVVMQPSVQEEGTVTAVLERGYTQGDRVLRPARVVVSSGPAEA